MKKITTKLLVLVFIIILCSCSKSNDPMFADVTAFDSSNDYCEETAPVHNDLITLDLSDVVISTETVKTVFYDGTYQKEDRDFDLEFTSITLNEKKTVEVPNNCYIRIPDNRPAKYITNKTPICAVLYDETGKREISINDKRLIALMNFNCYEGYETNSNYRFQSQGQVTNEPSIFSKTPRLVITYSNYSSNLADYDLMQVIICDKEYYFIYNSRQNIDYPEYSYEIYSVVPYGDILYNNDTVPPFLKMFGFVY